MRQLTDADVPAAVALINESTPESPVDEQTVRRWLTDPADDVQFALLERDGRPVAYADVGLPANRPDRAWLDVRIPRRLDEAALAEVIGWSEDVARGNGRLLARVHALPASPFAAYLERRGYRPIRFSFEMRIDLEQAPPEPHWPDGLLAEPIREGDERRAYEVSQEAFADHWEFTPRAWEQWAHHMLSDDFDPALWLVAREGEAFAGVCLCSPRAMGRPDVGYVDTLAVRRPWRRRGLGRALLLEAFRRFYARDVTTVTLSVDGENTTGAVRLYESVGMVVEHRHDLYERRLD